MFSMFWPMRSSDPEDRIDDTESSDVQTPAGPVVGFTHISRVNADVPKAVAGTPAGDASAALLRRTLPAGAAHGADGDGDALTDTDGMRDADVDAERDAVRDVDLDADLDAERDAERDAVGDTDGVSLPQIARKTLL